MVKRTMTFQRFVTDRIRIQVTSGGGGYSRITEVEAWGLDVGSNVALAANGAVASSSSTNSSWSPSYTIDNERAGVNWAGGGGGWVDSSGGVYPDWLQVVFNGRKRIDRVVVYTLQDNYAAPVEPTETMTYSLYGLVDFTVEAWNGASWVTVATVTGNNLVKRTVAFAAVTTDRIRVVATSGGGGYSRITEVEAWGRAAPSGSNFALASSGSVASASTTYGTYTASYAIDNDRRGSNWAGGAGGWIDNTPSTYPDWLQVDFGAARTIDRVVVYTLQDDYTNPVEPTDAMTFTTYGIIDFTVEGWNGASWLPLATVTGNNLVKRAVTFNPTSVSAIRVNVNNSAAGYSRITEVEAWGE
jgi:hypothetical protein